MYCYLLFDCVCNKMFDFTGWRLLSGLVIVCFEVTQRLQLCNSPRGICVHIWKGLTLFNWHLVVTTGNLFKLVHLRTYPHGYWHLVVAIETRTIGKQAVSKVPECCLGCCWFSKKQNISVLEVTTDSQSGVITITPINCEWGTLKSFQQPSCLIDSSWIHLILWIQLI